MCIRKEERPDEAKRQRIFKAWMHGVEVEDLLDRFAPITTAMLFKVIGEQKVAKKNVACSISHAITPRLLPRRLMV